MRIIRPYGEGSYHQRQNGNHRVWVYQTSHYDKQGKRYRITGTGSTRKQARSRWATNWQRNELRMNPRGATLKLSSFLEQWLTVYSPNLGAESRQRYRANIQHHVIDVIGDKQLRNITEQEINELFNVKLRKRGVGESARRHTQANLRTMFNVAIKLGFLDTNPTRHLNWERVQSRRIHDDKKLIYPRTQQYLSLLRWLKYNHDHYYALFLTLGLGLRQSEALGLEWDCIKSLTSSKKATIEVRQQLQKAEGGKQYGIKYRTKNGQIRRVPIPDTLRRELLELRKEHEQNIKLGRYAGQPEWTHNLVFKTPELSFVRQSLFSRIWRSKWERFKTEKPPTWNEPTFRPHYVRHIAASVLLAQGTDIKTVSEILGHSATEVTLSVYSHSHIELARAAIEQYGKVFT